MPWTTCRGRRCRRSSRPSRGTPPCAVPRSGSRGCRRRTDGCWPRSPGRWAACCPGPRRSAARSASPEAARRRPRPRTSWALACQARRRYGEATAVRDDPPPADPSLSAGIRRRVVTEVTGGPAPGMGLGWARRGRRLGFGLGSGPELALEPVLGLIDRALVGTGGEVLPTTVADHEGYVGLLPCLERLRGLGQSSVQDRPGGDSGEDAFELEQFPDPAYGVPRPDREPGVDEGLVVQLGDEPLVEVAQTVDQLAVPRLGGDDPHLRLVLAEVTARAHQRSRSAQPRNEVGHRWQVGEDLRAGTLVVRERVRRVAVLVEHDPVGVLVGDPLGHPNRLVRAAGGR